ncbi:MAG: MCE family protein [Phycisphaeraceae bacterium]|nr:MCE family protein [Phycisphaeraceae bacterium]
MASKVSRNNVIAGLFVVGAMLLALFISIMVSGAQNRLASTHPYTIRFSLMDGASGLKPGSPVTLGGQEVGRVTSIAFTDREKGAISGVDVRVAVRSDIPLHEDAWAFLERPLLGSMSAINVSSLGGSKPVVPAGGVIVGTVAPPSFLAQAGYGPEQVAQVKEIINDASQAVDALNRIVQRLEGDVDKGVRGALTAIEDINQITGEWRTKSPEWTAKVDAILAAADGASRDLQAAVTESRAPLRDAIETLDRTIRRFDDETMSLAADMIRSAKGGADEFREANARLNRLLKEEEPTIQRTLANFRLASDEIKLLGVEVRRAPWKLLYTPTMKELDSELFYDAARTYAQAVSDLRAASEALEAVSGGSGPSQPVESLLLRLQEAFKRYEDAERALLKHMTTK